MKYLTLEYIKAHSRILHDCENEVLVRKGTAAENAILRLLNRSYENLIETYEEVPDDIIEATLMLVDHLYKFSGPTEAINLSDVPYSIDFMIKPFMIFVTDDE